ncbi:hypothetical protein TNCV_3986531 [Trichonephila clavipes]|nr:hypothetical protein TNCV_3986531 [Trichonephila clavipes]
MDAQLKVLLEGINALKTGQEETKQEMQKYLDVMQKSPEECGRENSILKVEGKIAVVEENIKKVGNEIKRIKEQVEERIEGVAGNFSQRVEDLGKKTSSLREDDERKQVCACFFSTCACLTNISETVHL